MHKEYFIVLSFVILIIFIQTCNHQNPVEPGITTGTVTDIDGNVYKTVKIGKQWWMAENLKVTRFRNGDTIPVNTDDSQWLHLNSPSYCVYDNDTSCLDIFGCLYNWFVAEDSRKVAPGGWHVPSDAEWKELELFLGMTEQEADMNLWRGTGEGGQLKDTSQVIWLAPNSGATDAFGFKAIGSGYHCDGFHPIGETATYWTRTEKTISTAWGRCLAYYESRILRDEIDKTYGYSIRCVKD